MVKSAQRLEGRVAIVTGGASGIGRATVLSMLAEGASVTIADVNEAAAEELAASVAASGNLSRLGFRYCDVSSDRDVRRVVEYTVQRFGRLDCFINNAGFGGGYRPLIDLSTSDWDSAHDVNLKGVFLGIKYAARQMIEQGEGGSIVNVSSVAANFGSAGGADYTSSKGGVSALTRSAATQLAEHKIRVNAVAPGLILTPLILQQVENSRLADAAVHAQPLPIAGQPELIAPTFVYLASEESRFVTGEIITIDGGASARGSVDLLSERDDASRELMNHYRSTRFADVKTDSLLKAWEGHQPRPHLDSMAAHPTFDPPSVVVIAGVSRGLGRAACLELDRLGYTIIGCARNTQAIEELRSEIGPRHHLSTVDISQDDQVANWAQAAIDSVGPPSLILNVAAIGPESRQLWRSEPEEVSRSLSVNIEGAINIVRNFVPVMIRQRRGIVVNFSSGWGRSASEKVGIYCASKWAIEGLTKVLALELPPQMAAVSLHPGIVSTEFMAGGFGEAASLYPPAEDWAKVAIPYILDINASDNGCQLAIPGMTEFRGIGTISTG